MKKLLAIALVVVTLGGIVALVSSASAGRGDPDTWCGATTCPPKPGQNQTIGSEHAQPQTFGKSR
jgi:hypothetical protein